MKKEEEDLDPEDVELDEHYTIETRSKCKQNQCIHKVFNRLCVFVCFFLFSFFLFIFVFLSFDFMFLWLVTFYYLCTVFEIIICLCCALSSLCEKIPMQHPAL